MSNTNEREPVIYKNKALRDLYGIRDVLVGAGDPFLANIIGRAIECIMNQEELSDEEIAALLNIS